MGFFKEFDFLKFPWDFIFFLYFKRNFATILMYVVMKFDIREIGSATMILFAVIDIIGSIPIIIDLRKKAGHIQSEKATIVAGILMVLFLFVGAEILKLIGIDVNSFAVAGAFILFFLALEMILGITLYKDETPETSAIVPLAFPLIAGAGTMTTLLSLRAEYDAINIIVAIIINIVFVYIVLKSSNKIEHFLGKQGINVIRKIFGVILLAIAVKLFAANIQNLFK
ncbi:multiple antibiotic resistance protein [Gillisia sp. Hel_I_86]|nr:multiple antibiotic resistance protein [Gillisia sp. Hel_I_86]